MKDQFVPIAGLLCAIAFFMGTAYESHREVCPVTSIAYKIAPLPVNRARHICQVHHGLDAVVWIADTGIDNSSWLFQCKDDASYDLTGNRVWPPA